MKKYIFLLIIPILWLRGFAQVTITEGAQWVNNGNVIVVINNMDLVNNGTFTAGNSTIRFAGDQNSTITGNSTPVFNILELAKTNNAKLLLDKNIGIGSFINFVSGLLDLNNNNILLNPTAYLAGESDNSHIIGSNGGFVEITQDLNVPVSVNPGNFGATITSNSILGSVTIRRGHQALSGSGLSTSLQRYYSIIPQNNSGLGATLRLKYFDSELNGQDENTLVIYQSNDSGVNWNNLSQTSRNINLNYIEKTGVNSLSLQTLANDNAGPAVEPFTGLVFNAKKKKPTEVELNWSTVTETNMNGFEVERRLDNENGFAGLTFISTLAPGGNSINPLSYKHIDPNSYAGTSYYRLKIIDLVNNISYSEIKTVTGKGKKGGGNNNFLAATETDSETAFAKASPAGKIQMRKITVGPNPNNGNFWFVVSGIEKETMAALYTIDGKLLNKLKVINLQEQKVNGLRNGVYLLQVAGFNVVKIIVLGNVNGSSNNKSAELSINKN